MDYPFGCLAGWAVVWISRWQWIVCWAIVQGWAVCEVDTRFGSGCDFGWEVDTRLGGGYEVALVA